MADFNSLEDYFALLQQPAASKGGYGEGELKFTNLASDTHDTAVAINPKTGKPEIVYAEPIVQYNESGQDTGTGGYRYYFKRDKDRPATAQQISADTLSEHQGANLLEKGVIGGLGAMVAAGPGAALLSGAGEAGTLGSIGDAGGVEALNAADAAAGLTPEFGTTAAYDAGMGLGSVGDGVLSGASGAGASTGSVGELGGSVMGTNLAGEGLLESLGLDGLGLETLGSVLGNPLTGAVIGGVLGGTNLGGGQGTVDTTSTSTTTIPTWQTEGVQNELNNTPNDPWKDRGLRQLFKQGAGQVRSGVDSIFEGAGRYGSGAHQGVMGDSLGHLYGNIFGNAYNANADRRVRLLTGNYGGSSSGTQQTPFFTNPVRDALSGAFAGGMLGRYFGG